MTQAANETFADYLARYFIAKKGFVPGCPPEARALEADGTSVLTLCNGLTTEFACIVDREADPNRKFLLNRDQVLNIARNSRKGGSTLPVVVSIFEIGPGNPEQVERLGQMKRRLGKAVVTVWLIDPEAGMIWSNAPWLGRLFGQRTFGKLLAEPRLSDADLAPPSPVAMQPFTFPWLTVALALVLAAVFVAEWVLGVGGPAFNPSVPTLGALGALSAPLVLQNGEWWRLLSAVFLHADIAHLLFNCVALLLAGLVLERLIGRLWFLALFFAGGLGGSLLSLALNSGNTISVGASGAIMGLVAAGFSCSFRLPQSGERMRMQTGLLQILIPALLPLTGALIGHKVDYGAHFGGAIIGALAGLLILRTWLPSEPLPRFRRAAAGVAAAGSLAAVLAFGMVAARYGGYAVVLMPNDRTLMPNSLEQAAELVVRYPRDPRPHLYYAGRLLDAGQQDAAERELRQGLSEPEILRKLFPAGLEARMRTALVDILILHNSPEAKDVARPLCEGPAGAARDQVINARLCDQPPSH